jgi:hypothetical protein
MSFNAKCYLKKQEYGECQTRSSILTMFTLTINRVLGQNNYMNILNPRSGEEVRSVEPYILLFCYYC